eukprot:NODE_2931_length_393_cov_250.508721_g2849_i0.p3 GENE.NODE_2931_length_393_cov_250.508721_g2849_i0~~NODE_2931_length_393_cov_250.508721_g2849_i0.p3  ORF type:complete len:55 (-),score=27.83 NODE_2931_length_393_cov_250.508721_g2849_i0:229-369(-)
MGSGMGMQASAMSGAAASAMQSMSSGGFQLGNASWHSGGVLVAPMR